MAVDIENVDLLISVSDGGGYSIRVIVSPQGRTDDAAKFPAQEIRTLHGYLRAGVELYHLMQDLTSELQALANQLQMVLN